MGDMGFFTWYHDVVDSHFIPIILPEDADEVTAASQDGDWYICNVENPENLKIPFIISIGAIWTIVPPVRVINAGTIVGYVRSLSGSITLRCFGTSPPLGSRNSLIEFPA
jgi:hypothetical protein